MAACENATPIRELNITPGTPLDKQILESETPWVIRNYLQAWPVVQEAENSPASALNYLAGFYSGRPINAFLAEPESVGAFFYNEDVTGFNFVQVSTRLDQVFEKLLAFSGRK